MKNEQIKTYSVGITIYNTFYVEAETPEDARQQVRDMGLQDLMFDSDFNITCTDEHMGEAA